MASKTDEKDWTDRDDIAARVFEAMISGTLASGKGIESDGTPEATAAYGYAEAFLRVRRGSGPAGRP